MPSPYPDMEKIAEVMQMREQGLSYRVISKKLNKDVKTCYTWHMYGTGEKKPAKPGWPKGRSRRCG